MPPSSSAENVSRSRRPLGERAGLAGARSRRRAPSPAARRPRGRTGRSRSRRSTRCVRIRSSKPSKRAESSVSRSSPASSSTTAWSSWRPCGVSAIDAVVGHAAVDGVERGRDDVDAQHHPRPAAVRRVVDLAVRERRRVAVAEEAQVELRAEHGRQRALLGQPAEGVRNQGEDVDLHRAIEVTRRANPAGDDDPARREVDLADARLVHRQRGCPSRARGRRSRRPGRPPATMPSRRPPSSTTSSPTSWKT